MELKDRRETARGRLGERRPISSQDSVLKNFQYYPSGVQICHRM